MTNSAEMEQLDSEAVELLARGASAMQFEALRRQGWRTLSERGLTEWPHRTPAEDPDPLPGEPGYWAFRKRVQRAKAAIEPVPMPKACRNGHPASRQKTAPDGRRYCLQCRADRKRRYRKRMNSAA